MIASGPRGRVEGPLLAWLQSPGLAERAQALGAFCRYGTCLTPNLSELAILVTAEYWRAPFEWYAHAPIAAKAGHTAENIEALRTGKAPTFTQEDERIVYADGYSSANAERFETVDLMGCTNAEQAWREGRYHLAAGRLRPRVRRRTPCGRGDPNRGRPRWR
jgi:alkylhydroperoxidase family enzyme